MVFKRIWLVMLVLSFLTGCALREPVMPVQPLVDVERLKTVAILEKTEIPENFDELIKKIVIPGKYEAVKIGWRYNKELGMFEMPHYAIRKVEDERLIFEDQELYGQTALF